MVYDRLEMLEHGSVIFRLLLAHAVPTLEPSETEGELGAIA